MIPKRQGFTLIELLVVISIVALLSSVVLSSLNSAREKSRVTAAQSSMRQIALAVEAARNETGQALRLVTGSGCTRCASPMQTSLAAALNTIMTKGGNVYQGVDRIIYDPWGSVYRLDENEGEGGAADCRRDVLESGNLKVTYNFPYATAYCKANPAGQEGWIIAP